MIVDLVPPNQDLLIDAYCGAGFFAKALLDKFERVIGIDWDRFAIVAAKQNASEKETYIAGDVETELTRSDGSLNGRRAGTTRDGLMEVDRPYHNHHRSTRNGTHRRSSQGDKRSRAGNIDLRVVQSADSCAGPKRFAAEIRDQFGHTVRHVSADSRDRGRRALASRATHVLKLINASSESSNHPLKQPPQSRVSLTERTTISPMTG